MRIIGHRGAASLAPENTIESIYAAKKAGVDAIEFDIRVTKDLHLVLSHDSSLQRTHGYDEKVSNLHLHNVKKIKSTEGHRVPTLEEALKACGSVPAVIEAKGSKWAIPLSKILNDKHNNKNIEVISFNQQELARFSDLCPDIPLYILEHRNPYDAINSARIFNFDGIDVNFWTLNPLTYLLAKRHNLKLIVFTVDRPWMARLLKYFYPGVDITTNVPQKMQNLRVNKRKYVN